MFLKQPIMLRVLYALVPVLAAGIYFFGWRVLALLVVCTLSGLAAEWVTSTRRGAPITTACFVTCWLYALSLPPTMPFWMAAVGVVVGILFGKEVFGGFGRNFANPAIVGRAFIYVCFPIEATGQFVPIFRGWPGGLLQWSLASLKELPGYLAASGREVADAITSATPMLARRDFGFVTPTEDLFFGSIGGTFQGESGTRILAAGSTGEVCSVLILLAGIYLMATKTANWRLTVSALAGTIFMDLLLHTVFGINAVPRLAFSLFSGAILYAAVFMVTDPVSAPKKPLAMFAYGGTIGMLIVLLRWKAQFSGAAAFAILLGNICGPLFDRAAEAVAGLKKAAPAEGKGGPS